MKKKFAVVFLFFALVVGGYHIKKVLPLRNATVLSAKSFTVYQSVSTNTKKTSDLIKYEAVEKQTALELLKKTAIIKTKGEAEDAFVISIDDQAAQTENREYWAFYVNGKASKVGAGSYQLTPNDKIEWKIEKY